MQSLNFGPYLKQPFSMLRATAPSGIQITGEQTYEANQNHSLGLMLVDDFFRLRIGTTKITLRAPRWQGSNLSGG